MNKKFLKFLVSALIVVAIPVQAFGYDYIYSKKYNYVTDNSGKPLNGWHNFTTDSNKWNPKFKEAFDKDANSSNGLFFTDWVYFENGKFKTGWFKSNDGNWYYLSEKNGSIYRDTFVDGYYVNKNGVYSSTIPADSETRRYYTVEQAKKTAEVAKKLIATGYWKQMTRPNIYGTEVTGAITGHSCMLKFTKSRDELDERDFPLSVYCDIYNGVAEVEVYVASDRTVNSLKSVKISPEKFVELFDANKFRYYDNYSGVGGGASGDLSSLTKTSKPYVYSESELQ